MSKKKNVTKLRSDLSSEKHDKMDFLLGGSAELVEASEAAKEAPTKSKGGRPPRKEKTKRVDVFIRLSDARAIERLGLDWAEETDSLRSMKVTPIMRSLAAIMVPVLESLPEAPVDEEHLRELLRAAVGSE